MFDFKTIKDKQVRLAIVLKLNQLQREQLSTLKYEDLEAILLEYKWKKGWPFSLADAIDDIYSLRADEIVAFLAKEAIIEGKQLSFRDYQDLFD